ncbi:MAG: protein phosphatase 2C domain-containing protein [Candidatus Peribacteria bacterium]|jgi:hypothetical protein|nr:protein phosphatase 2C domain-containing protein [Candidatus Peribacteria bacterium]
MNNLNYFEIAGASVPGTSHAKRGMNNQDHFTWLRTDDFIIAVVSDGCGSTKYSEVGSRLLSTIFTNYLAKRLEQSKGVAGEILFQSERWWDELSQDVLARIRIIAQDMGNPWLQYIKDYFLATLVGVIVRKDTTCVFSCGDGVFAVNGNLQEIGPFEGNKPPYLAYHLLGKELVDMDPSLLGIQRYGYWPTEEIHSLLIGTDGVGDLCKLENVPFPAQEKLIGKIDQFWSEEIYFTNPQWMQNVLTTINTEKRKPVWAEKNIARYPGLLKDDTTLLTLRKKEV